MKTYYQKLLLMIAMLLPFAVSAQDSNAGDIKITVLDEASQPMPGAVVMIVAGGPTMGGQTNLDGNFTFRAIPAGVYSVQTRMPGYKKFTKTGVVVNAGQTSYTTFPMELTSCDTCVIVIMDVKSPVDPKYSTLKNINADQIKTMAVDHSNVLSMVTGMCSDVSTGANGQLVMRGSREGASTMYVDGEKLYGTAGVPGGSIEQVTVLSGGIPAAYGDMTGGVVIISTKSYYTGMASKQRMYDADAEARAAMKKALLEKSGQHKDNGDEIIEQAPATTVH